MEEQIEVFDENLEDEIEAQEENVYYIPSGEININTNGTHDVTKYSQANVDVQPSKEILEITENGLYDVTDYKNANVQTSGYGMSDIFNNITDENHDEYCNNSMFKITPEILVDGATTISGAFKNCDFLKEVTIKFRNCKEPVNFYELCRLSSLISINLIGEDVTYLDGDAILNFQKVQNLKIENVQLAHGDSFATNYYNCLNNANLVNVEAGDLLKDVVNGTYAKAEVELTNAINLTKDSLISIISSLGIDNKKRCILILGEENIAKLSSEELQMITDKGWTYE